MSSKGARPDLFRDFVTAHAPCRDFALKACMRYGPALGDRLAQLMSHDSGTRIPKPMEFLSSVPCTAPEVLSAPSPKGQLRCLIDTLQRWTDEAQKAQESEGDKFRQRRALVLLCWKGAAKEVAAALREAGLLPAADGQAPTEDACIGLALRALCRALLAPEDSDVQSLDLWAWTQCWPGVGPRAVLRLMDDAASQRRGGRVLLSDIMNSSGSAVHAAGTVLKALRDAKIPTAAELLESLTKAEIPPKYQQRLVVALKQACSQLTPEAGIVEALDALRGVAQAVSDDPAPEGEESSLRPLLIEVMTLHASKGLTADYVVLVDAFREVLPAEKPMDRGRRLAYVALSRARRAVTVIYPRTVFGGQRQRAGVGASLATTVRRPMPYVGESGLTLRRIEPK
jgi:hypothetical protein